MGMGWGRGWKWIRLRRSEEGNGRRGGLKIEQGEERGEKQI